MTSFAEWLDAQNGVNLSGLDLYATTSQNPPDGTDARLRKFIETPRDLATFVHIDQLYQAYFNACLLMLDAGVKPDIGFPNSDTHPNNAPVSDTGVGQTRTGFATFGGPHVLSLMTEVASRCLRAVRRQKFQVHLRARPFWIGLIRSIRSKIRIKLLSAKPTNARHSRVILSPKMARITCCRWPFQRALPCIQLTGQVMRLWRGPA